MTYSPKGTEVYNLNTIVLDLNGTLAVNGKIVEGVTNRLATLKGMGYTIYLFSGDQRGNAQVISEESQIILSRATTTEEKAALTKTLDKEHTVAIGNARIDIGTFENAKLSIATLQGEGIHASIIKHVDIIMPSILDALDLLINSDTFEATMRK